MNSPTPTSPANLTRRELLRRGGLAVLAAGSAKLLPVPALAATPEEPDDNEPPTPGPVGDGSGAPLNRFPRFTQEYNVSRVREIERAANARRAALRTRADAENYVADVRAKLRRCFAPFPEKCPLNPRITAKLERDGYRVENVIFDSRPGYPVTANLYVPTGRPYPLPGVIGTCGHSNISKASGSYQMFAQALARQGYVTLIFDPPGQGERVQHTTPDFKPRFGEGVSEHFYVGNHLTLVGENLPSWFVWDGIRAVDYLLTRPEVDPRHVGVTGNSGGGTQATWLCGVEPRLTMAAPSCFITTERRNIENEHAQDPEQYPWHLLALGLDHSDLIAAMAPRPVIILGQEKDYFDARGFEESAGRLRHLYRLLGAEENFSSFLGSEYHGFAKPNREAMYGWFNRHTGIAKGHAEPAVKLEKPALLQCTKSGQVAEFKPATAFTIGAEMSRRLSRARAPQTDAELRRTIATVLNLPPREGVPDYRILRALRATSPSSPKRSFACYVLETEPDIPVLVYLLTKTKLLSRPPRGRKRAVLYVSHRSSDAELREDPWLKKVFATEPDSAIYTCDVRGVGESAGVLSTQGPAATKGSVDNFHAGIGLMMDYPTPAQRTFDVLRVLDWLKSLGHEEIHLVARGWGAIPGTFAATLHDNIVQVTLKQALISFSAVAEAEEYHWPLATFVPGILHAFDLPDCYRALAAKKLRQVEPLGAEGVPVV